MRATQTENPSFQRPGQTLKQSQQQPCYLNSTHLDWGFDTIPTFLISPIVGLEVTPTGLLDLA